MNLKDWGIALLVVLVWGLNFVVIRWGLEALPPLLMGALRFLLCALPAIFFIRPPRLPLKWLLAYGLLISFGQFALLFSAMHLGMPAGLASLVLQAQAIFTFLLAMVLLGEKLQWHNAVAMLIAGGGMAVLASQSGDTDMTLIGFVLTLGAALSWAAGNIVNRKIGQLGDVNLLALVVWGALVPPLPFMAASFWFEGPELIMQSLQQAGWQSLGVLTYLAFGATLFGYGAWAYLLKHNPASQVAPLTLLVPIVGLASAWLLLGETLNLMQAGGIVLVMAGLLFNVFGGRILQVLKRRTAAV